MKKGCAMTSKLSVAHDGKGPCSGESVKRLDGKEETPLSITIVKTLVNHSHNG